jgi:hypothetical protein
VNVTVGTGTGHASAEPVAYLRVQMTTADPPARPTDPDDVRRGEYNLAARIYSNG